MKTSIPDAQRPPVGTERLRAVSAFAARHLGLHFPPPRWDVLARRLMAAAREHATGDVDAYLDWLLAPPPTEARLQSLAAHLTVGETYFFREPAYLEGLRYEILPALVEARRASTRTLRLWSAGCCTGEEPYTLAALLDLLIDEPETWTVELYGTDLNPRFLAVAERGHYRAWSFRNTPSWFLEKYFRETGQGAYEVVPALRQRVRFSPLNLAASSYPGPFGEAGYFDVILCRNVLMYFNARQRRAVLRRLAHALDPAGYLLLSATEHLPEGCRAFRPVRVGQGIYYRKATEPPAAPVAPARSQGVRPLPVLRAGRPAPAREDLAARSIAPRRTGEAHPPLPPSPEAPPVEPPRPAAEEREREAEALFAGGRFEECLAWIGAQAAGAAPWHGLRARALANLGRYEEAQTWCEAALTTDPLDPALHYLRASILQARGDDEQAVEALRQALFLDPDFAVARLAYGHLLQSIGRVAAARKQYRQVARLAGRLAPETPLPESDGLTAGQVHRLAERLAQHL